MARLHAQDDDDRWCKCKVVEYDLEKDHFKVHYCDGTISRETLVRSLRNVQPKAFSTEGCPAQLNANADVCGGRITLTLSA